MKPCEPTGVLRDEHRLILRVVDALEATLGQGPGAVGAEELGEYVTFFRLFTDAWHHGKEEDLLFEALAEHGFSKEAGPLAALLDEHREGRALVRRMADAVGALGSGDPEAWPAFAGAGHEYVGLLRRHIEKEDGGFFHVADDTLPEPACRKLCQHYAAVCVRRFEGRSGGELEELGERLARGSRGPSL